MIRHYRIRPLDTLFFRDGRPFEQEDEGMADIHSVFPPFPSMVTGAFRAAVARALGWDGRGDWPAQIVDQLGDGPERTGRLRFGPPVLLREHADRPEALCPAPRHLLRKGDRPLALLAPGRPLRTDAGELPLPESRGLEGAEDCGGCWLDAEDAGRVLRGRLPRRLIRSDDLWVLEHRVGLQRDVEKRTAVPGMLYAASQVRLFEGVRAPWGREREGSASSLEGRPPVVSLGLEVRVDGEDVPDPEPLAPLGGFRRLAGFERLQAPWRAAAEPAAPGDGRYLVLLSSPARFDEEFWKTWGRSGAQVPGLPGRLVLACSDRPVLIGGWDGRRSNRGPVTPMAHLPAGSVLFMEGDPHEVAALFREPSHRSVGRAAEVGFGRFVVGHWPQQGS